jgi:hypothetical protein
MAAAFLSLRTEKAEAMTKVTNPIYGIKIHVRNQEKSTIALGVETQLIGKSTIEWVTYQEFTTCTTWIHLRGAKDIQLQCGFT